MTEISSTSDARTSNNTMRHKYRTLNEQEKEAMDALKDAGQEFIALIERLGNGREYALAKTKMEEAVMWAVKGLTA